MNKYSCALLIMMSLIVAGCVEHTTDVNTVRETISSSGKITDSQLVELLRDNVNSPFELKLNELTEITDPQAKIMGRVFNLSLNGVTSLTDLQAENLSDVTMLYLNGLTLITDSQA
ncbi:MAG: hypothetical protein GY880_18390, partial [Planctomycetaceae bacterium]|nr:hypothetical protein [Planctomycetaceae bacterium]